MKFYDSSPRKFSKHILKTYPKTFTRHNQDIPKIHLRYIPETQPWNIPKSFLWHTQRHTRNIPETYIPETHPQDTFPGHSFLRHSTSRYWNSGLVPSGVNLTACREGTLLTQPYNSVKRFDHYKLSLRIRNTGLFSSRFSAAGSTLPYEEASL